MKLEAVHMHVWPDALGVRIHFLTPFLLILSHVLFFCPDKHISIFMSHGHRLYWCTFSGVGKDSGRERRKEKTKREKLFSYESSLKDRLGSQGEERGWDCWQNLGTTGEKDRTRLKEWTAGVCWSEYECVSVCVFVSTPAENDQKPFATLCAAAHHWWIGFRWRVGGLKWVAA